MRAPDIPALPPYALKNASKCSTTSSTKYSRRATQCEPPTTSLCLPTLSKIHQKLIKNASKTLPERSKRCPDGLWKPFGNRQRVQNRFLWFDSAIFETKIVPKFVKYLIKMTPWRQKTLNSRVCRTLRAYTLGVYALKV